MIQVKKRVLITGGGSGGHIFPGLAVAHYLMRRYGWNVCWLGALGHLESDIVPKYGVEIKFIRAEGFSGKSYYKKLISLLYLFISVFKACSILQSWKPDVVLGVGGYVSVAVGIAAWFCRCPMILHEQNSISGLANRFLSMIAKKVLQGFPGAFACAETVGNPIRDTILTVQIPEERLYNRGGPIRLLIIGGSQGTQIFNEIIPQVILKSFDRFIVWHQVGKGNFEKVYCAYGGSLKNIYKLVEFIDDISIAYAWADMVICRAGALTVSEIASVGLAAIFVPFIHEDFHQYWNAVPLQRIGAARIIKESDFTIHRILKTLDSLSHRALLLKMAQRARLLSIPDATRRVAYHVVVHVIK